MLRKEDDRFLRGRGQYVADFRLTGMQEVAFVRSPVVAEAMAVGPLSALLRRSLLAPGPTAVDR